MSAIGLASNVKWISLPFWESRQEFENHGIIVNSRLRVPSRIVFLDVGITKSHTRRLFYIQNVCNFIPGMRIGSQSSILLNDEWPMFGSQSQQSRTTRSTIGPQDYWIILWIVLRLDKPVKDVSLMVLINSQIARELIETGVGIQSGLQVNEQE